jgi:geranylgeranyl pyrophosphate synthase
LNAQWSPAATVLSGDFIFARAAKLAAETDSVAVMRLFAETLATIVNGEITQLFSSRGIASREDYERRIYSKTASMFELATAAAAILSPVPPAVIEKMRRFGYEIGMAFQIVDDVLDFTGEQATVGKPVASDLRQGLITLPSLNYLKIKPQDPDLQTVLGGNHYNNTLMDRLVVAIRKSGAIELSMDVARQYVERGLVLLTDMPNCPERQALEDLAYYIVRRDF